MGRPKCFDRTDLLQKAIAVFWKKGFSDTSLQDLEKATGVNKSGLYSEFNDKQDLFLAALELYLSESQAVSILTQEPLGWKNIENFLTMGQTCNKGKKGCFAVNTIRDVQILPAKAKQMLIDNMNGIKEAMVANLKAEGVTSAEAISDIILTFNSGNCLSQNAENNDQAYDRAREFLALLKQQNKSTSAHTASW